MASLTVEELKKALANSGIELPSNKMKKEDYVKLYEEHFVLNESVGAAYSSDEEGGQATNNLNGSCNWKAVTEAVAELSNDDLFQKLKEQGLSVGPILPNTRKVYEKKYLNYLQNENTNGFHGTDTTVFMDPSEISDSEIEIINPPRRATPQPSTSKKTPSREPSLAKEPLPPPRRISFIEEIPSGTNRRIIKPIGDSSLLRQRNPVSVGDDYVGKWSPKMSTRNVQTDKPAINNRPWKKIAVLVTGVGIIALLAFIGLGWSPVDPYKLIEQEAEELTGQQV